MEEQSIGEDKARKEELSLEIMGCTMGLFFLLLVRCIAA